MTVGSEGLVLNPVGANNPISSNQLPPSMGRQGEYLVSGLRGKYGTAAINKALFSFNVTAQTIPLVSSAQTSIYSIWNPPSSGTIAEWVDTELGQVVATTSVNTIGWYLHSGAQALGATFTTKAIPFGAATPTYFSARAGDIPNGQLIPYTAMTLATGAASRIDIIGAFGAATDAGMTLPNKVYDGRLWVPPGTLMTVFTSTAAGTAAGVDISTRWVEWPAV